MASDTDRELIRELGAIVRASTREHDRNAMSVGGCTCDWCAALRRAEAWLREDKPAPSFAQLVIQHAAQDELSEFASEPVDDAAADHPFCDRHPDEHSPAPSGCWQCEVVRLNEAVAIGHEVANQQSDEIKRLAAELAEARAALAAVEKWAVSKDRLVKAERERDRVWARYERAERERDEWHAAYNAALKERDAAQAESERLTGQVSGPRIAALEAQTAVLAGALSMVRDNLADSDALDYREVYNARSIAKKALTADVQHLAQLDAARREVCAAAAYYLIASNDDAENAYESLRLRLDALAKLGEVDAATSL